MQRFRYWVHHFFGFSKTETNGFVILLPLILLLIFSQPLYQYFVARAPENYKEKERNAFLDSLVIHGDFHSPKKKKTTTVSLFYFNPNTVSKKELTRLGLPSYLAQRIVKYRSKGGQFRTANDLLKIYGLDSSWYVQVHPFIDLPVKKKMDHRKKKTPKKIYAKTKKEIFDLNMADSVQLQSISGIGPVLSTRIIKYRRLLGGFIDRDQLHDIYGLDTETVSSLALRTFIKTDFVPKKININAAASQLSRHPYISYKLAKIIMAYRFQHGNFKTINGLLDIKPLDSIHLEKLKPYLKITP